MHRFFLLPGCIQLERVEFPADLSRQISKVLRLRPDEHVLVLDDSGNSYDVALETVSSAGVTGRITACSQDEHEALTHITLYLGLTQREKFELILQKCTEVGVKAFVPLITKRSLVQSVGELENKTERWQRIIREAAEQSGRSICPKLLPVQSLARLAPLAAEETGFVLWEEETALSLRSALRQNPSLKLNLLIGPEGGLAAEEIEICKQTGFRAVSLGKRILRMETAAIVAAAVTLFERGDMENPD